MPKVCAHSTGKLPLGGLLWNSMVRIIDHPNMTPAVYCGHKAANQTKPKDANRADPNRIAPLEAIAALERSVLNRFGD